MVHQNKWYIKTNDTPKQSTFPLCYQMLYYIDPNKTNLFPCAISNLLVRNKPYFTTPGNTN